MTPRIVHIKSRDERTRPGSYSSQRPERAPSQQPRAGARKRGTFITDPDQAYADAIYREIGEYVRLGGKLGLAVMVLVAALIGVLLATGGAI